MLADRYTGCPPRSVAAVANRVTVRRPEGDDFPYPPARFALPHTSSGRHPGATRFGIGWEALCRRVRHWIEIMSASMPAFAATDPDILRAFYGPMECANGRPVPD